MYPRSVSSLPALSDGDQSIPFDPLPLDGGVWLPYQFRFKRTVFAPGGFEASVRGVDRQAALDRFNRTQGFGDPVKARVPGAEPEPENLERSRRRAKTRVRQLAKNMGVTHLLTLTTRGRVLSRDQFVEVWGRFLRLYARVSGERFAYIAVLERHKADREHLHLHAAVASFLPVQRLRRLWYIALGGRGNERGGATPGAVNMKVIPGKHANRRASRIARYIAKYLTKDAVESFGKKRYFASKGHAPESAACWLKASTWAEALAELVRLGVPFRVSREDFFLFPDGRGAWFQHVPEDVEGLGVDPPPF
jgi:hypothetical protein